MLTTVREIGEYRSLLRNLVTRDLKVRYKRSLLGVFWTMLNPFLMMLVFTLVFGQILRVPVEHFAIFFLSAYLLWNFVAQTTSWSTSCLLGYAPLMKKIYVPKAIFVLATVLSGLVNLLISLVPLALIMVALHHPFHLTIAFLPVSILLATVFSLGLSLLLAPLSIMFADIVPIYQVVQTAWMYVTPVMYPISLVPPKYRGLVVLNPMSYLVEVFRAPIFSGTLPDASTLVAAAGSGLAVLVLGWLVFDRYTDRIAYYI